MDKSKTASLVEKSLETIVPALEEYIRIPNQSPHYDPEVLTNGYQDRAVELLLRWSEQQKVEGMTTEVVREPGRTPVILFQVPAQGQHDSTVLMYGHLDKQPPLTAQWSEGLHPYQPVRRGDKLYGRGSADDGYSTFAALTAIRALQEQRIAHPAITVLIEASEESGSPDLMHYLQNLSGKFGNVGLIVCLDSGCGDYERMWLTTSLRGVVGVQVKVEVLKHGVHSGSASGIVPSSFRGVRTLLDALEDSQSGKLRVPELYVEVPDYRVDEAKAAAAILGSVVFSEFPWAEGVEPMVKDAVEALLNRTWRPTLSVTGADGIPAPANAGNVLRASTSLVLSFRLPPTLDPQVAREALRRTLSQIKLPCNEKLTFDVHQASPGWNAPKTEPWLHDALQRASSDFWGKPCASFGEGGSIPFMGLLGKAFPKAQFVVTGVLGPGSNAHGPDEFLDIKYMKNLIGAVSHILAAFSQKK